MSLDSCFKGPQIILLLFCCDTFSFPGNGKTFQVLHLKMSDPRYNVLKETAARVKNGSEGSRRGQKGQKGSEGSKISKRPKTSLKHHQGSKMGLKGQEGV